MKNTAYHVLNKYTGELIKVVVRLADATAVSGKVNNIIKVYQGVKLTRTLGYDNVEKVFRDFETCYANSRNKCVKTGVWSSGYCDDCDTKYGVSEATFKLLGNGISPEESNISTEYNNYIFVENGE